MGVVSVDVLHSIDGIRTTTSKRKTVGYRVVVDNQADGIDVIFSDANIPTLDVSTYVFPFSYGTDNDDSSMVCRSLSRPRKTNTQGVWYLEAEFVFERDKNPVTRGVLVTPVTKVESEIVEFAEFIGWYKPKTGSIGSTNNLIEDDEDDKAGVTAIAAGKIGPITNSAGTPVLPGVQRNVGRAGLVVQWSKLTPVSYDQYIDHVNNANVTIVDTYGAYDRTFAAGELMLISARQEPVDYWNLRVLETTLEFEIVEDNNDHFELDRGLSEYVDVGDYDDRGGEYESSADLPPNNMRPIVGADGRPIGQPVPFDGKGKVIPQFTPEKARWLRWRKNPSADFANLAIGVYT
jgi:hypothetical protein